MNEENKQGPALWTLGVVFILLCALAIFISAKYEDIEYYLDTCSYPKEYSEYVEDSAKRYGIEPNLIYAMIKAESDFCTTAVSKAGAIGLMQIMPSTYQGDICKKLGLSSSVTTLFFPKENIESGTYYFSKCYLNYGSYIEALAAYNAGIGNVKHWLADPQYSTSRGLIVANIPFAETRAYITRVMKYKDRYDELYGKTVLPEQAVGNEAICHRYAVLYGERYGVDPRFIMAIAKAESNFNPEAVSPVGAVGVMQIMRPTYGDIQAWLSLDEAYEELTDAELNIQCGAYYIHWLSGLLEHYPEIAAAYNGGIGKVRRWLKDPAYSADGITLIAENIPIEETRRYVKKVMGYYEEYCALYPTWE